MQHPHLCVKMSILQSKVLIAPFQPVSFAECWLADQLNSLSPLFLGLRDLLCFYTYQINWRDMWSESPLSAGNHLIATVFVPVVLLYYIMKWDTDHSKFNFRTELLIKVRRTMCFKKPLYIPVLF